MADLREEEAETRAETRADTRILRDYAMPTVMDTLSGIRKPPIPANNFEIKPAIIHMVQANQFGGSPIEDPNAHIASFMEICDTFKHNGVSDDAIRLRLFPFSLRDKAKSWLQSLPPGTITTWNALAQRFLAKFFPPGKTAKLRNEITSFTQHESESLYEAWERYKELLRRCPHHGLPDWLQLQIFYNGMMSTSRTLVDAAAGGSLMGKRLEDAYDLLEEMAANAYQWPVERNTSKKALGVHELDVLTTLSSQVASLSKQVSSLTAQANVIRTPAEACDLCGGPHLSTQCLEGNPFMPSQPEQAHYVGNQNRQNDPFSNTYNPGWRNHPNLGWRSNQNVFKPQGNYQQQAFQPPNPPQQKVNLEDALAQLTMNTSQFMARTDATLKSQEASIKNLEVQMGQIANMLNSRQPGTLPSDTERNPREYVNAIALRSGKELNDPTEKNDEEKKAREEEQKVEMQKPKEDEVIPGRISFPDNPPAYVPPVPYPQRLVKAKLDKQFGKFLEVFKKLHINIPFADALAQMPSYAKFMKEILSKKRKLEEFETVALTEECSAILQKKLPPKLKDPGSFCIPCTIGQYNFERALCDLGASVNLMPLSVYRKLGLGEVKPTTISLLLADRSIKHPRGILEDVLVKVDKFIFPADFIVLDMEEDQEIPIILGRPFLATGGALIDVKNGKLTLSVQDEQVSFDIFKTAHSRNKDDTCFSIDSLTIHEKDIVENHCSYPPPTTSKTSSSFSSKTEVHDQQPDPKFEEVDLKGGMKKKGKNGKKIFLSLFSKYGKLDVLDRDQKIKISRKKLKKYIDEKINALKTTVILKDPG